ncbi:MAG: TIGR03960 family B12-binding radical SAM protein [bacterium]
MSWKLKEEIDKLLSKEVNCVYKKSAANISVALVYPNTYSLGMSNLGIHTMYYYLNKIPDVVCERVFLPDQEQLIEYKRTSTKLFSLESKRQLCNFNIIAFSISYENDYLNILEILSLGGVSLFAKERNETDPIVIAGGVCCSANPEPLADFIDLFVIGEGEKIVTDLLEGYKNTLGADKDKGDFLKAVSFLRGIYVPSFYKIDHNPDGTIKRISPVIDTQIKIEKNTLFDIDNHIAHTQIFTETTDFGDMYLIELSRGCSRRCNFCLVSSVYSPLRNSNIEKLQECISLGIQYRDRVGLVGGAISDYPQINELGDFICNRLGKKISVASLRADSISSTLLNYLVMSGYKTITLAPEAGSQRLRQRINKGLTEDEIIQAVELIIQADILNIKLYFMIGFPGETEQDLEAIISLIKKINDRMLTLGKNNRRLGKVILSINPFIPKPQTKFQLKSMDRVLDLSRKITFLKLRLKDISNTQTNTESPKLSLIQAVLARGDRKMGRVLLAAYKNGGNWKRAFKECNLDPEFYACRERGEGEVLPWSIVSNNLYDFSIDEIDTRSLGE